MAARKTEDRDIYKLWWDYLKRSEVYEEICKIWAMGPKEGGSQYHGLFDKLTGVNKLRVKFKNDELNRLSKKDWGVFFSYMKRFGNVHKGDFNEWWNKEYNRVKCDAARYTKVYDFKDKDFYQKVFFLESLHDRSLAPDNNIPNAETLFQRMMSAKIHMFVAIPLVGDKNMSELAVEIKRIRDGYRQNETVKKADIEVKFLALPSTRIRKDELEDYLVVHDGIKKDYSIAQIIAEKEGKKSADIGSTQRKYYRYKTKAEAIIKNVEKGIFPGKY